MNNCLITFKDYLLCKIKHKCEHRLYRSNKNIYLNLYNYIFGVAFIASRLTINLPQNWYATVFLIFSIMECVKPIINVVYFNKENVDD